MPRAATPEWRRRKQPILDHLVAESIARGYAELIYAGCETHARAEAIRLALYRASKHVPDGKGNKATSLTAKIEKAGDGYQVRFRTFPKVGAHDYMLKHYGEDRTKWPYSPWRHDPNFDPNTYQEPDNG